MRSKWLEKRIAERTLRRVVAAILSVFVAPMETRSSAFTSLL